MLQYKVPFKTKGLKRHCKEKYNCTTYMYSVHDFGYYFVHDIALVTCLPTGQSSTHGCDVECPN